MFGMAWVIVMVLVLVGGYNHFIRGLPEEMPQPREGGQHQCPPATHPELAPVLDECVEHVNTQKEEGNPYDALHHRIDSMWDVATEFDGYDSQKGRPSRDPRRT